MAVTQYSDRILYRRLAAQARPYSLHIAAVCFLSLLSTPVALLTPLPLKIAVDSVLGSHPAPGLVAGLVGEHKFTLLVAVVALFVVIAFLDQVQQLSVYLLSTYTGQKMILEFRAKLFRHVQSLSLAYHDSAGTADANYRIQWDAQAVQYIMVDGLIPLVTAGFTLAAMIIVTARIDWQLALIALGISPVLFMTARSYRRFLRRQARELKQLQSSALSVVQEVLSSLRVVKAFGQEDREHERFIRRSHEGMWGQVRLTVTESGFGLLTGMTTAVGTAAVLFVGVEHVQAHVITLGDLLLVMGYLAQLYVPLETIGRKVGSLQTHLASAERAFTLLDMAPDVPEAPDAIPLERARGEVIFRRVSFAYPGERPVLQDISVGFRAGSRIGIVGTTGAGKSTLMSLLTRFYDPTEGSILLDGADLKSYKVADLRNQFAIVLQDPLLFSTTIGENIAYARPAASDEEIVEAAKAANAHDFIQRLPDGYDTLVGERGMRLSGGERQRISLARAFLKDAPILILDEPTSAVDVKTEELIMDAMKRLMQGRTTCMIAHRISTLDTCQGHILIQDGRLAGVSADGVGPLLDLMGTTSQAAPQPRDALHA